MLFATFANTRRFIHRRSSLLVSNFNSQRILIRMKSAAKQPQLSINELGAELKIIWCSLLSQHASERSYEELNVLLTKLRHDESMRKQSGLAHFVENSLHNVGDVVSNINVVLGMIQGKVNQKESIIGLMHGLAWSGHCCLNRESVEGSYLVPATEIMNAILCTCRAYLEGPAENRQEREKSLDKFLKLVSKMTCTIAPGIIYANVDLSVVVTLLEVLRSEGFFNAWLHVYALFAHRISDHRRAVVISFIVYYYIKVR